MFQRLPPDRDPELRHAIALDADDQRGLLATMFGEAAKPRGNFQHVGVRAYFTPRGSFVCVPRPMPTPETAADATQLHIGIDHYRLDQRHQPRTAERIAEVQRWVADYADHRGLVTVPCPPPETWDCRILAEVLDLVASHLPGPREGLGFRVSNWRQHHRLIVVSSTASEWSASIRLPFDATPGITFGDSVCESFESFAKIVAREDALIAEHDRSLSSVDSDDDDDDLDGIEKAARRALHGDAGLSGGGTAHPRHDLMRRLERLEDNTMHVMETLGAAMKSLADALQAELNKKKGQK